jgi:hypothetical protein
MDLKESNILILKAWNDINKVMLQPHTLDTNGYLRDNWIQGDFNYSVNYINKKLGFFTHTTMLSYGGISNRS